MSSDHVHIKKLRERVADLQPVVEENRKRASARSDQVRTYTSTLLHQAAAQALGALLAAAIVYLIALASGALDGTRPLTVIAMGGLLIPLGVSIYMARWLYLPSKRAEARLTSAILELRELEIRQKLERGEPLSEGDEQLVALGVIYLKGLRVSERQPGSEDG